MGRRKPALARLMEDRIVRPEANVGARRKRGGYGAVPITDAGLQNQGSGRLPARPRMYEVYYERTNTNGKLECTPKYFGLKRDENTGFRGCILRGPSAYDVRMLF